MSLTDRINHGTTRYTDTQYKWSDVWARRDDDVGKSSWGEDDDGDDCLVPLEEWQTSD